MGQADEPAPAEIEKGKLSIDDVHKTWELLCRFYQDAVSQKHLLESFRTGAPAHQAWLQTSTRDAAAVMRAVHVLRAHMLGLEDGPVWDVNGERLDDSGAAGRRPRPPRRLQPPPPRRRWCAFPPTAAPALPPRRG